MGAPPHTSKSTILIVDDNPDNREALRSLLAPQGYVILEAANGLEALHLMQKSSDRIRIILLDLQMPVMSGWEFLAALRRQTDLPQAKIIVISAHLPESLTGVDGVLKKPVDVAKLMSLIAQQ